ncbi:endocuticle structural glycoprotein SgAbd-1-like [Bicyclus anynana]|uniref:Endocuticle structural glycoprotein SgAbd-1-like n=1 Tax=Bicyclus anynana TaxID=110368 RepID=A0A6J1NDT4_BICAN|nr:endocuticle structural glycoprotein SgAbd-1-like [Bicyclus anynana]
MRVAVVILACVLAVAQAQLNAAQSSGKYVPDDGRYQYNNNRYNPFGRYNQNQYGSYNNRYNQYNPYGNQYNQYNRNQYNPFKPYVTSTIAPFRPSVTVTPAPPKVTVAPVVKPSEPVAPAVTVAPVVTAAPVFVPVAPSALPVITAARVAADSRSAETVKYGNEINPDGSYNYFYETNNGIAAQAQGTPRNFGGNPPVVPDVVEGGFSWYSPEGQLVSITYVADENGYQPVGDAIPQPPEVPAQIARALAYIARSAPVPAVARTYEASASASSN